MASPSDADSILHLFALCQFKIMRRLNLVFLAILLLPSPCSVAGMHLVHGIQVRRNASALLNRAREAETGHDLEKAEQSLSQYLNLRREDGPAWEMVCSGRGSNEMPIAAIVERSLPDP